jgi:predicted secreted protein
METKSCPKVADNYRCESCHYTTCKTSSYNKHLLTAKHKKLINVNTLEQENPEKSSSDFLCEKCNKQYRSRVGLWKHNKKCIEKPIENTITIPNAITPELLMSIFKQNQDIQNLLVEQNKINQLALIEQQKRNTESQQNQNKLVEKVIELSKEPRIVNNGSMTQNNNQKFNLQFFLNDTCKDAITIKQFIDNIQISMEDLESVGKNGFVKGISDIVLKQLNTLDVTKRPIHCTDLKREVIYLKEEVDKWNKDDDENTKLKNVIRTVENKSWNKIPAWQQENPDVVVLDTPENILNAQIIRNVCGDGNEVKLREKIVKVIAKETHLEKENSLIETFENPPAFIG